MFDSFCTVRRARAIVLAGLFFCGVSAPRVARAQLEVSQFELFLRPSLAASTKQGTFTVTNVSGEAVTTQLLIGDWIRSIDGTNQYSDTLGTMAGSCKNALTVFPTILRLSPRQSQAVTVTYNGDPRAASCWNIVFIGTAPKPATLASGAQVTVELRQGIKVYVEPPSARPDLQIDSVETGRHTPGSNAPPSDTVGTDIIALVHNPGLIQSRVRGRVEYRSLKDSLIATGSIDEFPILPGAQRRVRSKVPTLTMGHYVALVILDFGGSELVAAQFELDIR
jgi:P pilus assembly chaperone PapD